MLKDLLNAISFLTIFPLKEQEIRKGSVLYFPVVGLLIGIIISITYLVSSAIFPINISVILVLIAYILLSGGLHLDGFADTVDGLSGGRADKTRILEIMSDSHIGAHGVVALICLLGLKFSLVTAISPNNLSKVLLLMPVIGRWTMLISMFYSKPAKQEGLGTVFIENSKTPKILIPTFFAIILSALLFQVKGIVSIIVIFINTLIFTDFFSRKAGGMTGDTIGSINEINEVVLLIYIFLVCNPR